MKRYSWCLSHGRESWTRFCSISLLTVRTQSGLFREHGWKRYKESQAVGSVSEHRSSKQGNLYRAIGRMINSDSEKFSKGKENYTTFSVCYAIHYRDYSVLRSTSNARIINLIWSPPYIESFSKIYLSYPDFLDIRLDSIEICSNILRLGIYFR